MKTSWQWSVAWNACLRQSCLRVLSKSVVEVVAHDRQRLLESNGIRVLQTLVPPICGGIGCRCLRGKGAVHMRAGRVDSIGSCRSACRLSVGDAELLDHSTTGLPWGRSRELVCSTFWISFAGVRKPPKQSVGFDSA